jgi:hypothetical protein
MLSTLQEESLLLLDCSPVTATGNIRKRLFPASAGRRRLDRLAGALRKPEAGATGRAGACALRRIVLGAKVVAQLVCRHKPHQSIGLNQAAVNVYCSRISGHGR